MNTRAKTIIEQLQEVVAGLRGYAYDVWTSTDVGDSAAVTKSAQFVRLLNEKLQTLNQSAAEIAEAIQQFAGVDLDQDTEADAGGPPISTSDAGIQTGRLKVLPLVGDYRHRFPYGFRLLGQSSLGISMWSQMYEMVLQRLAQLDPARFHGLPDNKAFEGGRRHHSEEYRVAFGRSAKGLHNPHRITTDVYADTGYSANDTCANVRKVLKEFGIPDSEFELYLRRGDRQSPPVEAE